MRVRVHFRFNAVTGEVEVFEIDDMHDGPRLADHDARHDRTAAEVARIIETNALIEEIRPGPDRLAASPTRTTEVPASEPERYRV
jgi:hypothetical protein